MSLMAFVRIAHFPGATPQHYEALREALADAPIPPKRLLFAAGPSDDGWQVVQVWETRADLDAFNQEWFLPVLRAIGDRGFPEPPVVTDVETVDLSLRPEA